MDKKLLIPSTAKSNTSKTALKDSSTQGKDQKPATASKVPLSRRGLDVKIEKSIIKAKPSEEVLAEIQIFPIERTHLDRVFELLKATAPNKSPNDAEFIIVDDLTHILTKLNFLMSKAEIDLMLWVILSLIKIINM